MNKRGQFFLIAAVVIIIVIIGFGAVRNNSTSAGEDIQVYDLSEQLNYESAQVIDQGVFNAFSQEQIYFNVRNISALYALQNPSNEITILYGNVSEIKSISYRASSAGSIGIGTGGSQTSIEQTGERNIVESRIPISNSKVEILIGDSPIDFTLKPGENLFIVVKGDKNEQSTISKKN